MPQEPEQGKVLRVDRKFRSHGPTRLKRLYKRRPAVERAASGFKENFQLRQLGTRGLRNAFTHVLLCLIAMLINALSAIKQGFPEKIRSPAFRWNIHV